MIPRGRVLALQAGIRDLLDKNILRLLLGAGLLAAGLGILSIGLRRVLRLIGILILARVIVPVATAEQDDGSGISLSSLLLYFVVRGRERIYEAAGRHGANEVRAQRRTTEVVEIERAHFYAIDGTGAAWTSCVGSVMNGRRRMRNWLGG